MKVGVVVPTYKKELFDKFYDAWDWDSETYDINLYIVEDNPKKTIKSPKDDWVAAHYCWKDIDKDYLGKGYGPKPFFDEDLWSGVPLA